MNTAADLFTSAQLQARDFFIEVDHPKTGNLRFPGFPAKFASGKRLEMTPAPTLGKDNQDVFGESGLGLSDDEVVTLRSQGII